ncbi:MAG: DUF3891 family protein [Anaerolineae bacterium]|jgi:hypothetical protein|nr:DUF3891 family protein [Anaerolineae bacterium]
MIVNQLDQGWEVIYHRSHALLAAVLASQWQESYRPAWWVETLAAIIQHDDEERDWEQTRHLTEVGMPLDFRNTTVESSLRKARNNLIAAEQQNRWSAWLISRHNHFLMAGQRGTSAEMDQFIDEGITKRARWQAALELDEPTVEAAYGLMNWADTLSLILLSRQVPDGGRWLEIATLPDGTVSRVCQTEQGFAIDPWTFTDPTFTISAEVRIVPQATFPDETTFRETLLASEVVVRKWTFAIME